MGIMVYRNEYRTVLYSVELKALFSRLRVVISIFIPSHILKEWFLPHCNCNEYQTVLITITMR